MDSVFFMEVEERARVLQNVARALRCSYICLWSSLPHPSNCLISMDGWYFDDKHSHPGSSSSLCHRLFDDYRGSLCNVGSGCVPGFTYKQGLPYLELHDSELLRSSTTESQQQFYLEAGIKTSVFMGCNNGEIELGFSSNSSHVNPQEIANMFGQELMQQSVLSEVRLPDQSHPSSSSSSLRSLSVGSPENSSLFLTMPNASYLHRDTMKDTLTEQANLQPQLPMQPFNQIRGTQFLNPMNDDAIIANAMLAVITSASSSSSGHQQTQKRSSNAQQQYQTRHSGSFRPYVAALAPKVELKPNQCGQKMLKAAFEVLKRMNLMKIEARMQGSTSRSTVNQLHMISERKRREKLNESFHSLRLLLPPGSKKDKASVLSCTRDYLYTLKTKVSELEEKNKKLEARVLPSKETMEEPSTTSSGESVEIQVTKASESSAMAHRINVRVTSRAERDMVELLLRMLECLNLMKDVSLEYMEANTPPIEQTNHLQQVCLKLQIQEKEWNEETFKEALKKAISDVAQPGPSNP
ncbi:putative transcription factor [Acorus gramineus]|uniref:Transcription factor n=1 Tax=Acorus gramineus TaxID=55184 RepID=A0AAV9A2F0_ACOGR|nr:putative transcription factor [Acorus gramineus]